MVGFEKGACREKFIAYTNDLFTFRIVEGSKSDLYTCGGAVKVSFYEDILCVYIANLSPQMNVVVPHVR